MVLASQLRMRLLKEVYLVLLKNKTRLSQALSFKLKIKGQLNSLLTVTVVNQYLGNLQQLQLQQVLG